MGVEFTTFEPLFGAENSFIYLLTIVLFLLALLSFIKGKLDILNPSFIYAICFCGCCMLAAIYTTRWNLPMHFNTTMIIIIMASFFLLGGLLAGYRFDNVLVLRNVERESFNGFIIPTYIWLALLFLVLCFLYMNYMVFLNSANQVTTETGFSEMLRAVAEGNAHQQIEPNRWSIYRTRFVMGIAYLGILSIWLNFMANQYIEVFKWGILVLLYVPFIILGAGRQPFLYLTLFSLISFFLVHRKKNVNKQSLVKEAIIVSGVFLAFIIFFLIVGIVNGKINVNNGFFQVFVHYAGTNISAFDVYINEMVMPDSEYIGTTTLDPLYAFLHNHGIESLPKLSMYITFFTAFGPVTTNVYTALYRYIHDFGYLGCAMVMFLIGFFYTYVYYYIYAKGLKNWMILVYSSIAYPIFLMGREERFFNEILTTSNLSFIIEILILYKFFDLLNEKKEKIKWLGR